jgi:hypothetical protein
MNAGRISAPWSIGADGLIGTNHRGQAACPVNSLHDNRQFRPTSCIGGQANSALNVQGGAGPFPVPDSPQFPVRCPLGSLHFRTHPFGGILAICLRLAVCEWGQPLGRALRVHRLPDGEIPIELDVSVRSREGLWPCRCIDDPAVDHFDDALAAPQILGKGGGRSRCIGSDSHVAADRSATVGVSEQSPPPGSAHEDTSLAQ